jgi:hypothetical protein
MKDTKFPTSIFFSVEAETNKYCPGGNDIGALSNLITWVLNFFFSVVG